MIFKFFLSDVCVLDLLESSKDLPVQAVGGHPDYSDRLHQTMLQG